MTYEVEGREEYLGGREKITVKKRVWGVRVYGGGWTSLLHRGRTKLRGMNGTSYDVFLELSSSMNSSNLVQVNQSELGKVLGVSRAAICRAVGDLRGRGLLKGKGYMMVNPRVAYRGLTENFTETVDRWERNVTFSPHDADAPVDEDE